MTISSAVDKFIWRFKNDKRHNRWNITESDVEALNTIIDFVQQTHKQQLQSNILFAKLYIMVYAQYLQKYNATVFDEIPQKEFHKLLSKPLEVFIRRFMDRMNESEMYEVFKESNVDLDMHPQLKTKEEHQEENERLAEALKDPNKKEQFCGQVWEYETVKEALEHQINLAINAFRNVE